MDDSSCSIIISFMVILIPTYHVCALELVNTYVNNCFELEYNI